MFPPRIETINFIHIPEMRGGFAYLWFRYVARSHFDCTQHGKWKKAPAFARAVCLSKCFPGFGDHFVVIGFLSENRQVIDIGQSAFPVDDKDSATQVTSFLD